MPEIAVSRYDQGKDHEEMIEYKLRQIDPGRIIG